MTHKLPDLPYNYSSLEPHIDTRTMAVHHDKHHAACINNLNKALENFPELQEKEAIDLLADLDAIPEEIRTAVRNNGGGHVNHSLFWLSMKPDGGGVPGGQLGEAINQSFGSFDDFKIEFSSAAVSLFGSGWCWLNVDGEGKLVINKFPNQDNPVSVGATPLLGLDVWEHAYYLKYENRRADYIAAWWNVVDWSHVQAFYNTWKIAAGVGQAVESVGEIWQEIGKGWKKLVGSD